MLRIIISGIALILLITLNALGTNALDGRIVNGYSTDIRYFPFAASLQVDGRHICGAAILSETVVVTAAHCNIYAADFYTLRIGSTFYNRDGKLHNITDTIPHPLYNRQTADYDIALMITGERIQFDENIAPIQVVAKEFNVPTGLGVVAIGWGTTDPTDEDGTSLQLQSAALRAINYSDCAPYFPPEAVTSRMLCAQNFNGNQDACTGDSGGPLIAQGKLLGIVSWGIACADGKTPGVYTNLPAVHDFISENMKI